MKVLVKNKINPKEDILTYAEYKACVMDLIQHDIVRTMENFIQHSDISCLEHSISVSYYSYVICKRLGLDYRSAARGGLLHDLFLYDWHLTKPKEGLHGFTHPYRALENATKYYTLNDKEKDIIVKHMWPLTLKFPKYKESFVVSMADKYCSTIEIIGNCRNSWRLRKIAVAGIEA